MADVKIGGISIAPGEQRTIDLELARLYDFTELTMSVRVLRGREPGPTMFVSGAIHGDEIVGPEIVKRLLNLKALRGIRGTLIAIPIVNVYGYNNLSRYLPDRRDLNRCFPGSKEGSLAARVAYLFLNEIVKKCQYGIDLHSGAHHRVNLPQIRAILDDQETERIAKMFGAPVILNSRLRDGSLREAAEEAGVKMLLFEGGEGLRLEEQVVRVGLRGVLAVMRAVGMLSDSATDVDRPAYIANSSYWVRAPQSGALRTKKRLGARVREDDVLGSISDAMGQNRVEVRSRSSGIIIGETLLPLVNRGDALFHVATFDEIHPMIEMNSDFFDYLDSPIV